MAHVPQDTGTSLVTSRKSSWNTKNSGVNEHRKRKSLTFDETETYTPSFDAVILPNIPGTKSFTFVPTTTILRAHLPLSWLSGSTAHVIRPGTVLRAFITTVSTWEYHILIAKLDPSGVLYALERVDVDAYVCHPLQSWVSSQWVQSAAVGAAPPVHLPLLLESRFENGHSRRPSNASGVNTIDTSTPDSPKMPKNRRGHLARLSILDIRDRMEEPSDVVDVDTSGTASVHVACDDQTRSIQIPEPQPENRVDTHATFSTSIFQHDEQLRANVTDDVDAIPSEEIPKVMDHLSSEHLRAQYLETLYVSKTSLAFYAKGPLSRARARARMSNASRSPAELVDFYMECVIPTKKLDLKYKESLLNKISSFATGMEELPGTGSSKPRKSKRTKLGKDGLWLLEDEYIIRWWKGQDSISTTPHTAAAQSAQIKNLVSHLRTRETEMHIILILEILAIQERDIPNKNDAASTTTFETKSESIEGIDRASTPHATVTKKPRELRAELDFLIDRLCIWQSVGYEDVSENISALQAPDSSSQRMKDRLHDFCKDIIVPFYGGKLPEQCHSICAKLGGAGISSQRPKKDNEKATGKATPGTAIVQERSLSKRKHQATAGNDRSAAPPPTLSRSATVPIPTTIKRESSERPMSRGHLQKSVSFSNREVDLEADARATAAKRRKLDLVAAQKRELDAAIEMLKRPNRTVVAKSFMDDVERRETDARSAPKKTEPIQITATPRRGGVRTLPDDEYDLPPIPLTMSAQETSLIPSSTAKPRGLGVITGNSRSSAMKRAVLSAIHDTPSRALARTRTPGLDSHGGSVERPQAHRGTSSSTMVASTPTTLRKRDDLQLNITGTPMRMKKSLRTVLFTPVKRSDVNIERAFKDAPVIPEQAGQKMDRVMGSKSDMGELSLYESLGWDDDYDL